MIYVKIKKYLSNPHFSCYKNGMYQLIKSSWPEFLHHYYVLTLPYTLLPLANSAKTNKKITVYIVICYYYYLTERLVPL